MRYSWKLPPGHGIPSFVFLLRSIRFAHSDVLSDTSSRYQLDAPRTKLASFCIGQLASLLSACCNFFVIATATLLNTRATVLSFATSACTLGMLAAAPATHKEIRDAARAWMR
jgi:hypothetical protein